MPYTKTTGYIQKTFSIFDKRMRFWKDKWYGNDVLCNSFPSLYVLVASKEVWVVELWDSMGEEGGLESSIL